jgi:ABC-type glycerol-3-phosphate transport system substrate-binding protein
LNIGDLSNLFAYAFNQGLTVSFCIQSNLATIHLFCIVKEEETMTNSKFNRRNFLKAATAAAAGSLLAACAPVKPTEQSQPAEPAAEPLATEAAAVQPVEPTQPAPPEVSADAVTYWVGWSGTYAAKTWEELQKTEEFKQTMNGQKFEIKGGLSQDIFLTAVAGGTPPDGTSCVNYTDLLARDVVVPIDNLVASSKIVVKDAFVPGYWDLGFYKGKMYGVPSNECFSRYGLYYNSKMVQEAGLDPNTPPQTWDEVLDWHQKITKTDSAGNLTTIGLDTNDSMGETIWDIDGWMAGTSWGFNLFDEKTGAFNIDNPQMIDYFATTKKFMDIIGIDNLAAMRGVQGNGSWGGSYNNSIQAMIIQGYWFAGECANAKPEVAQYNMATWLPVPSSRKGTKVQENGGHLVLFFKDSKHLEGMFKVAEFLNTKAACDVIFNTVGWLPALKDYLAQVDPKQYAGLDFFLKSTNEVTEWRPALKCPIVSFIGDNFTQLREKVYRNEMKPEEAAKELHRRAVEEYTNQGFGS